MATQPAWMAVVKAAKAGDEAAFDRLIQPLLQPAYRYAGAFLHDDHLAQDAVQDAAIKAWRKLDQLREGAEMRPWFFKIVANQCKSLMRSAWRRKVDLADIERVAGAADDDVVARVELRRALRAMHESKRQVLILHFYLDLSLDEIASDLGISVRGAETRLRRAKDELKQRMEADRGRR
jgi:RNA polymerase sigma-70 factor, ECF subfamily